MKKLLLIPMAILLSILAACSGFSPENPVNLGSAPSAMTPSTPESYTVVPQFEIGNTPEVIFVTQNPDFSGHQPIGTVCPPGHYTGTNSCLELPATKDGDKVSLADPNAPSIIIFTDDEAWACAVSRCKDGFWTDGRDGYPTTPRAVLFYNFGVEPMRYEVVPIDGDFEQALWNNALVVLGNSFIGIPAAEYDGEWAADVADFIMLSEAEDICFTGNGISPIGICTTP